jgi:hypothetical protein
MDYPTAYATLRRERFSARGARNALWLAEHGGTQRFGTLRITAWDGGRGPADYEIRRAHLTYAEAAEIVDLQRDTPRDADRLGFHCGPCHDARGTCCYRCTDGYGRPVSRRWAP